MLAAAAVAWLQLAGLPSVARFWTTALLIPLPALAVYQAHQLRVLPARTLPRRAAYISSIVSLWALALITLVFTRLSQFTPRSLGFFAATPASIAAWSVALVAGAIAILFLFRAAGAREAPTLRELLPQSRSDRALFSLLSVSAGCSEELVFRGFLLHSLGLATGSPILALLLSSGAFGVVHAYQEPLGTLRAALLGALLAMPLLLGQPIYAPIIAHVAIDLLSGLWLARHLLR